MRYVFGFALVGLLTLPTIGLAQEAHPDTLRLPGRPHDRVEGHIPHQRGDTIRRRDRHHRAAPRHRDSHRRDGQRHRHHSPEMRGRIDEDRFGPRGVEMGLDSHIGALIERREELGLSDRQVRDLEALRTDMRAHNESFRSQLSELHREWREGQRVFRDRFSGILTEDQLERSRGLTRRQSEGRRPLPWRRGHDPN